MPVPRPRHPHRHPELVSRSASASRAAVMLNLVQHQLLVSNTESIKNFYPYLHETDVIVCVAVTAIDGVCKA